MLKREVEPVYFPLPDEAIAALQSAAFSFPTWGPNLDLPEDWQPETRPRAFIVPENMRPLDGLLEQEEDGQAHPEALDNLHDQLRGLLWGYRGRYERGEAAAYYADYLRAELNVEEADLTPEQLSNLAMAKVYLSSVSALGNMGKFLDTNFWMKKRAPETGLAKTAYLESRKQFQEDVDAYLDHFADEEPEVVYEALLDTVHMSRLLVRDQRWIDAKTYTHDHIFVGSVLSERAVMVALARLNPQARYGTAEEDRSPIKADVVLPDEENGDFHVQVKMKWKRPVGMEIRPAKQPPHVTIPMNELRSGLTKKERKILTKFVKTTLVERALAALQTDEEGVELAAA